VHIHARTVLNGARFKDMVDTRASAPFLLAGCSGNIAGKFCRVGEPWTHTVLETFFRQSAVHRDSISISFLISVSLLIALIYYQFSQRQRETAEKVPRVSGSFLLVPNQSNCATSHQ
jgi:hypothetical protein